MAASLILWGHALAALLFGAMGLASIGGTERGWPRVSFAAASLLTALWALAVAGIDAQDVSTRLVEAARNVAWLCFAATLVVREGARGRAVLALYVATGGVVLAGGLLALVLDMPLPPHLLATVATTRQGLRVLAALGALILLCHLAHAVRRDGGWVALSLGGIWGIDLIIATGAIATGDVSPTLAAARGVALVGVGAMLGAAAQRGEPDGPSISRPASMGLIALAAAGAYVAAAVWAANAAGGLDPTYARPTQVAIVLGATMALLTLVSTPRWRAWARVKLTKHLFPHRYDYRIEWQRFTDTLGRPGDGEPLPRRLIRALADLTDSPGGLLLACADDGLAPVASWEWRGGETVAEGDFATLLASGHIVALDDVRDDAGIPVWLRADPAAWIVVPLIHGDRLTGAIALTRPPIDRRLDWEDLDLLRVAGRQAASYLAEDRAAAALADAQRFDEFNRRFAFLLHDIKNVASQLSLVARNAERHADNPAFRADMVETLRDGALRMTTLLGRLGERDGARSEPLQPVDVAALAHRLAVARRATRPIEVEAAPALALAAPARLEQALGHLVQNAGEASGDAAVWLLVTGGERVTIDVVDCGTGMSAEFVRDRLFRPFSSTKPGGFGIGAHEARSLVQGMGGTIEVDSREGEGTRFRIVLPAAPALEAAA